MTEFERAFAEVEQAAQSVVKAASGLTSAARQLQRAAVEGDLGKIRRAMDRLATTSETARQEVANARQSWSFESASEEAYLRERYEQELLDLAQAQGLQLYRSDDRLVAFPSIVRILPGDRAVMIDRKRVAAIRPSHLIAALKAAQTKKPRFASDRFLETLYRAYRLLVGRDGLGQTITLATIFESLTLLPGNEYDRADFTRDLYALDRSGLTHTKSGARFTLPAATGTRGSRRDLFTFVAPSGETVTYYGIRFTEGES